MGEPEARVAAVLTFAVPAFLLAGALAALVPLALHLIRRRPPSRAPLPTSRFLSEDPRTSVRLDRPTDLLLLALRMLLLLLVGAAFARPRWLPAPEGTSEIVLLDRGAAMAGGAWTRAVDLARTTLLAPDGTARGELVLFDTAVVRVPRRRVTPALFDSLAAARPDAPRADYAAALRAVLPAARELRGADSVRVTLLSAPRWSAWSDGLAALRRSAWRGSLAMPDLGAAPSADTASPPVASRRATVIAIPSVQGAYVTPALRATGWTVGSAAVDATFDADSADLYVLLNPTLAPTSAALVERARAGATVLVSAAATERGLHDALPWTLGRGDAQPAGTLWLASGDAIGGASGRRPGAPKPGATVLAAWDDGRPAAAAARVGRGCIVYVSADLEGGNLPFSAAYPRVLDRLARGCKPTGAAAGDAPLDAGARAVLRGVGPPALAASAIPGSGGGVPLGRWLMAVALAVALAETWLAYRRRAA